MKTVEEVADDLSHARHRDDILKILTAYAEEQNKYLTESLHLEVLIEESIKRRSREAALEEAAKMIEDKTIGGDERYHKLTERFAFRIRALKDSAK